MLLPGLKRPWWRIDDPKPRIMISSGTFGSLHPRPRRTPPILSHQFFFFPPPHKPPPPRPPPKSSDSTRPIFLLSTPPKPPPPACGRFELVREHLDVIVGPATDMRALHLHMYGSVNACVATEPGLLRGETQIMKHQVRSAVVALVAVAMVITLGNPANAEDTQPLTTREDRGVE